MAAPGGGHERVAARRRPSTTLKRSARSGPLIAGRALEQIRDNDPVPVVFIALHGPFGEDGTIQALCESADLTYTGAGVAASAIGMDKVLFKRLTEGMGMPSVPWTTVGAADWSADPQAVQARLADFARELPDPRLVVKPARLGSSIGISIVHHPDDAEYLGGALTDALGYGDTALIEAYIDHPRELEMSVVGNSLADLEVFGPGEIFSGHEFYDYTAKYSDGVSETTDSPSVTPEMRARIHELAAKAFLAIGATGFARVDFLASGDDLYLNEINTIPGFTPISLFPVLCRDRRLRLRCDRRAHRGARPCPRRAELAARADPRRPALRWLSAANNFGTEGAATGRRVRAVSSIDLVSEASC